jgi:aryl-alcohol dehydrogenase
VTADRLRATAAVLHERGAPLRLEPVELDDLRADEIAVRIAGVGICHTDIGAIDGVPDLPLPAVLGHEGAGVVERVGDEVADLRPGDRVVLSYDSCRACRNCRAGRAPYCEHFFALNSSGRRRDGTTTLARGRRAVHGSFCGQSSFATLALASVRNAVRVPHGTTAPLELLGPLGCSLMTGAGAVLRVLRPPPDATVAVFGAGAVGLAAVMAASAIGCERIAVVEPDPARRALAAELGATRVLEPARSRELRGVDFAVEAVGAPAVVADAVRSLGSPGTCATLGFRGSPNPVTIDQGRLIYGRTLTGVIEGGADPHELIPDLLRLHAAGDFPFERLITRFPLADVDAAVDAARTGTAVKPVLIPEG